MSKMNGPMYSGPFANMAAVYSAQGYSEKEIAEKILWKCNKVINGQMMLGEVDRHLNIVRPAREKIKGVRR